MFQMINFPFLEQLHQKVLTQMGKHKTHIARAKSVLQARSIPENLNNLLSEVQRIEKECFLTGTSEDTYAKQTVIDPFNAVDVERRISELKNECKLSSITLLDCFAKSCYYLDE